MNHIIQNLLKKPINTCSGAELRIAEIIRNYPEKEAELIIKGWLEARSYFREKYKDCIIIRREK